MVHSELVYQAYKRMVQNFPEDNERLQLARQTLKDFHQAIERWDATQDIDFITDFLTGDGPNSIAKDGGGRVAQPNFKKFMEDEKVRGKVKDLFMIRKTNKVDFAIVEEIKRVGLYKFLEGYKFEERNKPWLYVRRFLIMIFPEVFTTIASRTCLPKVAKELGVVATTYEEMQKQVKQIIVHGLKEKGVYDKLDDFQRAAVGWSFWEILEERIS